MTEYIFLLLSIGLAAVLMVRQLGHVVRAQTAGMAMELSGQHADLDGMDLGDGGTGRRS